MAVAPFPRPGRAPTAADAVRLIAEMEPQEHAALAQMLYEAMGSDGDASSVSVGPGALHFGLASLHLVKDAPDVNFVYRLAASA